tara:strand:+ start:537 stop:773 length:237 start_codon:yes stop_codon:yes gene_type:complete
MSQEMNLSEEDMKIRQDLASRLQNNILSIGDIEAAIGRLTKQKENLMADHLLLDKEIREFNGVLNEKYAPKEPVLEEA